MSRKDGKHARACKHWTRDEVLTLRREWGVASARDLLHKLSGRSWLSIRMKARKIGLRCPTRGLLSTIEIAAHWGVGRNTARAVVAQMKIRTLTAYPHGSRAPYSVRLRRKYVDPIVADRRFAKWLAMETARQAAQRLNGNERALWRQAVAMGLSELRPLRLLPEQWDEIARTVRR